MKRTYERTFGGRTLVIETGHLAQQANGAVSVRYGETVVLVTACASPQPREGIDFLPLTVDFEERLYAAGKIPGSFFRREGRPSTEAILAGRLTDRALRPLFPKGLRNDVQVIVTVLSADQENDPDVLGTLGASAALVISDIPFDGPIASVRVGYDNGQFIINPTYSQLNSSQMDLVVAATRDAVVMVEAGIKEVPEDIVLAGIRFGQEAAQELLDLQEQMRDEIGKPKMVLTPPPSIDDVRQAVLRFLEGRLAEEALSGGTKQEREAILDERRQELLERLGETYAAEQIVAVFEEELRREVRRGILERGVRPDGRGLTELRPITCEVGLLPRAHGSGLFTRGETQVLTIATLGSVGEEQELDTLEPVESKRFLHHYNFPPFSVGEVRRIGSPGRREIGHGALAERALQPAIPSAEEFPYTIRLVSEVMSSNGSTSMASVCGSTLALMDAGVPIKAPVAGAAMGLMMGEDGRHAILTDIAGVEDALGDMDFKVAGTERGITALQMDIKVKGITMEIMERALAQARDARLTILSIMKETIPESRPELSPFAPRMYKIRIPVDKIGTVIGPGGRVIRSIIEETKCSIDIEDDGTVYVGSSSDEMARRAIQIIEGMTREVAVGEIYTGQVTRITSMGAFVEILPGKEGLVRTSELADYQVTRPEDVVRVGDEIMVMVSEIDSFGRINLSRRAVLEGTTPEELAARMQASAAPRRGGPDRERGGRQGPPRRNGRSAMTDRPASPASPGTRGRYTRGGNDRPSVPPRGQPLGPPPPPRPPYGGPRRDRGR